MNRVWFLVALATFAGVVYGFGNGAPEETCDDMRPQHGADPQTTPFPYNIQLSKNAITSGGRVTITLSGKDTFKGFFVQARVGNKAIGHFDQAAGAKLVNCHGSVKNGITHVNNHEKKTIVLNWNAPKGLSEKVVFWVTVVKEASTFWVGHKSSVLTVGKN